MLLSDPLATLHLANRKLHNSISLRRTTQEDSDNSICFGKKRWGAYFRRNDRANSFANRELSSVLMITHVGKHNELSESGFATTPQRERQAPWVW